MTTMIERVARAIHQSLDEAQEGGAHISGLGFYYGRTCIDGYFSLEVVARAAIQAMREPTEGMVSAGYGTDDAVQGHDCAAIWRLMIDAARAEEPK